MTHSSREKLGIGNNPMVGCAVACALTLLLRWISNCKHSSWVHSVILSAAKDLLHNTFTETSFRGCLFFVSQKEVPLCHSERSEESLHEHCVTILPDSWHSASDFHIFLDCSHYCDTFLPKHVTVLPLPHPMCDLFPMLVHSARPLADRFTTWTVKTQNLP